MDELTGLFPKKLREKNSELIPQGPGVDQEAVSMLFKAVFFFFLKLTFVFGFNSCLLLNI